MRFIKNSFESSNDTREKVYLWGLNKGGRVQVEYLIPKLLWDGIKSAGGFVIKEE